MWVCVEVNYVGLVTQFATETTLKKKGGRDLQLWMVSQKTQGNDANGNQKMGKQF